MARQDALVKITKILLNRRNELRKRLDSELQDLGSANAIGNTGDAADVAFGSTGEEMTTKLAQLESKELMQIELALTRIKQGRYGSCDICSKKIPVARLNVLPYCTLCIQCQQQAEKDEGWLEAQLNISWAEMSDHKDDVEIDLNALEMDLSK